MMRQMNPESLKGMASLLQQYGRNGDTILAHINPKEAMLLDRVSGGGSMNPMTGMPEFFPADDDQETDGSSGDDDPGGMSGAEDALGGDSPSGDDSGGQEMDDFDPEGYAYADEFSVSIDPAQDAQLEDNTGLGFGDTRTAADMGIGTLASQVMPDKPGILEVLTAPIETIVSALTFGLVDPEFTGKDVLGVPGMTSTDLSRGMAGLQGPQPVGVEIGFSPIGTVGIDRSGVSAYGGSLTNTLTDLFSSGLEKNTASNLVSKNPDLANQLAKDKLAVAADKVAAISSPNPKGYSYSSPLATPDTKLSIFGETPPSFYSDPPPPSNVQTQAQAPARGPSLEELGLMSGRAAVPGRATNPKDPQYAGDMATLGRADGYTFGYAQGGPVSLDALYNNVRARRGPITGGQRSGGGIMSLR